MNRFFFQPFYQPAPARWRSGTRNQSMMKQEPEIIQYDHSVSSFRGSQHYQYAKRVLNGSRARELVVHALQAARNRARPRAAFSSRQRSLALSRPTDNLSKPPPMPAP